MAKLILSTIGSRYGSIDALNANFDAIEAALENTLSLDGTVPNGMEVDLDMNGHKIINMADPTNNSDGVTKGWLLEQEGNAVASADAAAASAAAAEESAVEAAASAATFGANYVSKSSSTGSAFLPTGATDQRDVSPSAGYLRFNSTLTKPEVYNGTTWGSVGGGATGGGADEIFIENGQTVTTNYTITTNKNAMSTGPITINSSISITVPSGSNWVVL